MIYNLYYVSTINTIVKFIPLFESYSNKLTALQRVRVKVDPVTVMQSEDLGDCPSYEGYVLEETHDEVRVFIVQPTPGVYNVPKSDIETDDQCDIDVLNEFKAYIILTLQLDENNPLYMQIINSSCFDEIELFLQQAGCTEEDLINLYKVYIAQ